LGSDNAILLRNNQKKLYILKLIGIKTDSNDNYCPVFKKIKNFCSVSMGKSKSILLGKNQKLVKKKKWKLASPFCVSNTKKAGFEKA
jgi:hypothetical protein